jgi:hypothetical protein
MNLSVEKLSVGAFVRRYVYDGLRSGRVSDVAVQL